MQPDHWEEVPHLTTAMRGPLYQLEQQILNHQSQIENWLRQQWRLTPPSLYASVDLRNAGFKLAPVDTNLFSAGFNNLNPDFMPLCIQAMQKALEANYPGCLRILLIPENHTRNLFYLESLATLRDILTEGGYDVRIGSLIEDLNAPYATTLPSGRTICLEPVIRQGQRLGVANFNACVILLNNDLSGEVPAILQGLEQKINPPLALGWATRLKSKHFAHYQQIAEEFAQLIAIDPWFISPLFTQCHEVDFVKQEGAECLVAKVDHLLQAIQHKYATYGIQQQPFVIVKADAGTYGMGIMTVTNSADLQHLNRKERTRMSASKGHQPITKVILQEGVYTFETWQNTQAVAEPVVYMIGQYVVGGFYRVHNGRGVNENLNAPGMHFEPLAFAKSCNAPDRALVSSDRSNRFYAYGVIARLALLAAAREKHEASGALV